MVALSFNLSDLDRTFTYLKMDVLKLSQEGMCPLGIWGRVVLS